MRHTKKPSKDARRTRRPESAIRLVAVVEQLGTEIPARFAIVPASVEQLPQSKPLPTITW